MTALTQENIDQSQKGLRSLIDTTGVAHAECCKLGLTDARDKLRKVQGLLILAEAEAGDLMIRMASGTISTKSGDK